MPNFNSLRRLETAFFGRFLSRFYRPPLLALVPEAGLQLAEVTSRLTSNLVPSRGYLPLEVTVVEGRFPANCLLDGLEIFVAAAVMTGITCVVQCYNNKSNHRAGISLHQSLAS